MTQSGSDFLDPDRLGVGEFAYAEVRKLTAIAAVFHAADRDASVGSRVAVDEDAAGFEPARNGLRASQVGRPKIAA